MRTRFNGFFICRTCMKNNSYELYHKRSQTFIVRMGKTAFYSVERLRRNGNKVTLLSSLYQLIFDRGSNSGLRIVLEISGGIRLQQIFNDMIKQDVKPFLSRHGFTKKSLTFSKRTESLVYIINFQKSSGNSADNVMFYVNCGIYAAELAQLQSGKIATEPKEAECHFRARIREIAVSAPDRFAITSDTNGDDLSETLLNGLTEVLHFFDTKTSARSIADYYIAGPYLHLGEESFHLLLQAKDTIALDSICGLCGKSTVRKPGGPYLKRSIR